MLVERTDLRVAAKGAVFEVSEAKRWLLGGAITGTSPICLSGGDGDGARFPLTAERFYGIGFSTAGGTTS
jgi:hypothetical protein